MQLNCEAKQSLILLLLQVLSLYEQIPHNTAKIFMLVGHCFRFNLKMKL